MAKTTTKKNVPDATLRNVRASAGRDAKLRTELNDMKLKLATVAKELVKLAARVDKLEVPF